MYEFLCIHLHRLYAVQVIPGVITLLLDWGVCYVPLPVQLFVELIRLHKEIVSLPRKLCLVSSVFSSYIVVLFRGVGCL